MTAFKDMETPKPDKSTRTDKLTDEAFALFRSKRPLPKDRKLWDEYLADQNQFINWYLQTFY